MNNPQTGKKVAQILDQGLDDIKQETLDRLQSARRASLENYRSAETIVNVGRGASARNGHEWHLKSRRFVSLVSLLLALIGIAYWQSLQQSDENEDIDVMLLIDDLPVNAYLDNEFEAWLAGS
jgi:CHASE3 domain sensor protein